MIHLTTDTIVNFQNVMAITTVMMIVMKKIAVGLVLISIYYHISSFNHTNFYNLNENMITISK